VPYGKIDPAAAYAAAFETVGMPWMRVIVALGALLGILTGVLVGQMAVARIFSAVGRAHLVFPVIGRVHPKYKTPAYSTLILGIPTILLALLSDLPMLVSAAEVVVWGLSSDSLCELSNPNPSPSIPLPPAPNTQHPTLNPLLNPQP